MSGPPTADDVRNALEASGFPFEMFVAREMRRVGMLPNESTYFEDPVSKKPRELDLWAAFGQSFSKASGGRGEAKWVVAVECKKSAIPWVLLSSEPGNPSRDLLEWTRPTTRLAYMFENELWREGTISLDAFAWNLRARGVVQVPTGKPGREARHSEEDERDVPFGATRKLAHVTAAELGEFPQNLSHAKWVYPILAVDAPLFAASLDESGVLVVTQVQAGTVPSPPAPGGERFPIVVCAKAKIPTVLRRIAQEIALLRDAALRERLGDLHRELVAHEHR